MSKCSDRRKSSIKNTIINGLIIGIVSSAILFPVNFFSAQFRQSLVTPQKLEKMEMKYDNKFENMQKEIDTLQEYKKINEQTIIRFEKAITKLETLMENFSKKLSYNFKKEEKKDL